MKSALDLRLGGGPGAMTMKTEQTGKWVGTSCGEYAAADDYADDYSSE